MFSTDGINFTPLSTGLPNSDPLAVDQYAIAVDFLGGTGVARFVGGIGGDILAGGDRDDSISGTLGNDTLSGHAGADVLDGGDGIDLASYAGSAAAVTISLADGKTSGGDADGDTLTGIEGLIGSDFADLLAAGENWGGVLNGGAGDDTLIGGSGSPETLIGGAGADRFVSGDGLDSVSYAGAGDGVVVDLTDPTRNTGDAAGDTYEGIVRVIGGSAVSLTGSSGDDTLIGAAGIIRGGAGNDQLVGSGSATLEGGEGADAISDSAGGGLVGGLSQASYASSAAGVSIDLTAVLNLRNEPPYSPEAVYFVWSGTGSGGDAEGDTFYNITTVIGSAFGDAFRGRHDLQPAWFHPEWYRPSFSFMGGAGDDTMIGGNGHDRFDGGEGGDSVGYVLSTAGVFVNLATGLAGGGDAEGDTLVGVEGVAGSAFNDVLIGHVGNGTLVGGGGDDYLDGGAGTDYLDGGAGPDTVSYAASPAGVFVSLIAGIGAGGDAAGDTLIGLERVVGSAFADVLVASAGNDVMLGGAGDDQLHGLGGADYLDGGEGLDTGSYAESFAGVSINLSVGTAAGGTAAGDVLRGIEGLIGSAWGDTLVGSQGADLLIGGEGGDWLLGSAGADSLFGGAGADRFVLEAIGDSRAGIEADVIEDFSRGEGDLIILAPLTRGDYAFVGAAGFSGGGAAQVRAQSWDANTVLLELDSGDGLADLRVVVLGGGLGVQGLSGADIVL
ncbi:calcium-binding protein [Muricoccus radiodurans]|uniref:calcium-binding protein n=1 Tax=Muricoccus radiodurans TaxID=2231721 RepID=UPI003CE75700